MAIRRGAGQGTRESSTASQTTVSPSGDSHAPQRWQERVVVDNDIHHGDPCIKGTRVPVSMIVGSLADGMTYAQIRAEYPQLSTEDISAALAYAADTIAIKQDILRPLPA
jgi:uncharacterized protein (DUF433 family)